MKRIDEPTMTKMATRIWTRADLSLRAVSALKALAREGAPMSALLECARDKVSLRSTPTHALMAFYRAFDVPISLATSLGRWADFSAPNPGV